MQQHSHPVLDGKACERRQIVIGRGIKHPKQECDCIVRNRHLDLRQALADTQFADEFAQRIDQAVHWLCQDFATMHVGEIRGMALPKADQHPALAGDVLDPKPGATAIVPTPVFRIVIDRRQPSLRLHLANALQIVGQRLKFDGTLLLVRGMLQRAAATSAIDCTTRLDTGA